MFENHPGEIFSRLREFNKQMIREGSGYINVSDDKVDPNQDPYDKKCTRIIAVDTRSDEIVRIFYGIDDAAKAFNRLPSAIKGAIYGYTKLFCGGRYKLFKEYKFQDAYPGRAIVCEVEPELEITPGKPAKSGKYKKNTVYVFTLDDVFIAKYTGVQEASDATGASTGCIMKVCRGLHRTSGKLKFSYTDKPPVYTYNPYYNLKKKKVE